MGSLRRLALKNIINCRDLGGYPCRNGMTTEFGRFLRCGMPRTPAQEDIVELIKYGVTTVIDLRGEWESETMPSVFRYIDSVDYHHISLFEINAAVSEEYAGSLEKSYEASIENYKENYAKALRIIADAGEGCVLLNCYFGKDRTGILSALLLSIAGAAPEDIIADYQVSYTYILPYIERERNNPDGTMWETNEANFLSDADNMAALLNFINKKYGSVERYIKSIGIFSETTEKIRRKFFNVDI